VLLASNEFLPRSNDGPDTPADTLDFYGFFSRAVRTHRTADVRVNVQLDRRSVLTIGGEAAADRERSSSLSLSSFGPDAGGFEARRHNTGIYVQAVGDVTDRWSYSLGGRVDRNSAFGTFQTLRASVAYVLTPALRVRASAGSAFKAPSFFENFSTGYVVGNPALRPERSRSAELGLDALFADGALAVKATGYLQAFADVIQYAATAPSPGAPNYFNVAAADANGLTLATEYRGIERVVLGFGYAWTSTKTTAAGFDRGSGATYVVGQPLVRRPSHAVTFSAARGFTAGGEVRLDVARVGERADRDFAVGKAIELPAYTKLDLSAAVPLPARIATGVALLGRIDNLLAARYQEVFRFSAPGRTVFAGLRVSR
jgi:vitamin B12 transporter